MTRLHFIGGEKGGVGKSVVARILAQYFIDRQIPFLGFDTDKSHGSLLRFYADFAAPVVIDRYDGLDQIIEAAAQQPERRIVVDLAAQTHRFLVQWMEDSALLDIRDELGLALNYWHVMDSGRDSADLLAQLLDQFGDRLPLVVVLNEVRGGDFRILESFGTLNRAKELGARVVSLGRLQDSTMQKIDAHGTSFWAASHRGGDDGPALGLLERQRVKTWLHRAYEEIGRLDPMIGRRLEAGGSGLKQSKRTSGDRGRALGVITMGVNDPASPQLSAPSPETARGFKLAASPV